MAGIARLRDGTPRWLAALLIGPAVVSCGVNIEDERALRGAPVGVAWLAYGVLNLLKNPGRVQRAPGPGVPDAAGVAPIR
ncbi:MAG: hypothetical protein JWP66_1417 [Naasia sp.]|nr:hypothetical protein [Naasia sp.]